ncbi:MAG: hypothetical protein F6J87_16545 [Spirulina sp. SIO3F2]|nr:hypothetical protein [Spirulina sp. SIO3F2]
MKSFHTTAALLSVSLISAASVIVPGTALAEKTYTVSGDLMNECIADGFSQTACECVIKEIADVTNITEFDRRNIWAAVEQYIEATDGDEDTFLDLMSNCAASYPG